MNNGTTPFPVLDNLPVNTQRVAYFLVDDETMIANLNKISQTTYTGRTENVSNTELETFWRIRHHDSRFTLAHAMQLVLNALPSSTKLHIHTS
jgi:hypothetical protein